MSFSDPHGGANRCADLAIIHLVRLAPQRPPQLVKSHRPALHVVARKAEIHILLPPVEDEAPAHLPVVGRIAAAGEGHIQAHHRLHRPGQGDSLQGTAITRAGDLALGIDVDHERDDGMGFVDDGWAGFGQELHLAPPSARWGRVSRIAGVADHLGATARRCRRRAAGPVRVESLPVLDAAVLGDGRGGGQQAGDEEAVGFHAGPGACDANILNDRCRA